MFDPRRVSAHSERRVVFVASAQAEQQDVIPSPTARWDYQTFAVPVIMQLGAQGNESAFSRDRSETFRYTPQTDEQRTRDTTARVMIL